jgi:hypothetical protein
LVLERVRLKPFFILISIPSLKAGDHNKETKRALGLTIILDEKSIQYFPLSEFFG